MADEVTLLVDAIRELAPRPDWIKDYAFPIFSAFFSAILGASVAHWTLRAQLKHEAERRKLEICNKWTLNAEQRLQTLLAIKANYHGQLTTDPFQRLLQIPTVLGVFWSPEDSAAELSFVLPSRSDSDAQNEKWRQVPQISALFTNYETLMSLWSKRNELDRPWRDALTQVTGGRATAAVSFQDAIRATSHAEVVALMALTEQVVEMTDDVAIKLNDFISSFPKIAEQVVDMKIASLHGKIANAETAPVTEGGLLEPSPRVDIKLLSSLSGIPEELLEKKYDRRSEKRT